ncbi:MAG: hypothetical protein ACEQSX_00230 [Baekduiaceae bacterium]
MRRIVTSLALCALLGLGGTTAVTAAPVAETSAKKRGCATKKTKKARAQCQKLRKTGKYRKGQVCALSKEKQKEYSRYGFFCLDISANQDGSLTYLEELE